MRSFRIGQPVLPGQNIIMAPQFQLGPPGGGGFASPYGSPQPIGAYNEPAPTQQAATVSVSPGPFGGTTILQPSAPVYEAGHPIQEAVSYMTPETDEFGGYAWPAQPEPVPQQWPMIQPIITIQQPQPQFALATPSGGFEPAGGTAPTLPQPQMVEEEKFPWWALLVVLGAGALIYEVL